MASLTLSMVGAAIGGPIGQAAGAIIGGMIDNVLFPAPKPKLPAITSSTYGSAITRCWGPKNRVGMNMIWSSGFLKESIDQSKLHLGKAQSKGVQAYQADLAFGVAQGEYALLGAKALKPSWLSKLYANGTIIFDASKATSVPTPDAQGVVTWNLSHQSHSMFNTVTVYPGNLEQLPDGTIEIFVGMGNVPAYRGTAYILIGSLQLTAFGNGVPLLNAEVAAQDEVSLAQIVCDICTGSSIDTRLVSTSGLTSLVDGFNLSSETDGISALQPLALVYDFDVAEVAGGLRCQPRGQDPVCAITNDQIGSHAYKDSTPDAFAWPREPELVLPRLAGLTFNDPARELNVNTQSSERDNGSQASQISASVPITLDTNIARAVCDRMLWEAQIGAQGFKTTADDRLAFLEPAKTYAFQSPAGYESVRLLKRARGANGVYEIEGKRDYSAVYFSNAPGAAANSQENALRIGGPVSTPFFVELPLPFPGITQPTIAIGLCGQSSPAWNGCSIYVATADVDADYILIGAVSGPSIMGVLTTTLFAYGGSNPDNIHTFDVDMTESGTAPPSISAVDAADAQFPYWIDGPIEFVSIETSVDLGANHFALSGLWRRLHNTGGAQHNPGAHILRLDGNCFYFILPQNYIGRQLYFRFVGGGETLASVTTYSYGPNGIGYANYNTQSASFAVPDISTIAPGAVVGQVSVGSPWTLPATTSSPPGSAVGNVVTASSTGSVGFVLAQNGTPIATVTFANGSQVVTTFTDAADVSFVRGDVLTLSVPGGGLNGMAGAFSVTVVGHS